MNTQRFLLVCCCCVLGPVLIGASAWYKISWSQEKTPAIAAEKCDELKNLSGVWQYIQCHCLRFLRATAAPENLARDAVSLLSTITKSVLRGIGLGRLVDEYESHFEEPEVPQGIPREAPPEVVRTGYFGKTITGIWGILYSAMRQKQVDVILSIGGWVAIACVCLFAPTFHKKSLRPIKKKYRNPRSDSSACINSEPDPRRDVLLINRNRIGENGIDLDQTELKELFVGASSSSTGSDNIYSLSSGETSAGSPSPPTRGGDVSTCGSSTEAIPINNRPPPTGDGNIPKHSSDIKEICVGARPRPPSTGSETLSSCSSCAEETYEVCQASSTGSQATPACRLGTNVMFNDVTLPFAGIRNIPASSSEVDEVFFGPLSSMGSSIGCETLAGCLSASPRSEEMWSSENVAPVTSCPSFEVLQDEDTAVGTNSVHDVSEHIETFASVDLGEGTPFAWTFRLPDHDESYTPEPSPFSNIELPSQPSPQAINIIQGFYAESTSRFDASTVGVRETHTQYQSEFTNTTYTIPSSWLQLTAFNFDEIHVWGPPETPHDEPGISNSRNSYEISQHVNTDVFGSVTSRSSAETPFSTADYDQSFFGACNGASRDIDSIQQFDEISDCLYEYRTADIHYAFPTNQNCGRPANGTGHWASNNSRAPVSHPASPDRVEDDDTEDGCMPASLASTPCTYSDAFSQNSNPHMPTTYTDAIGGTTPNIYTETRREDQQPTIIPLEDFEPYFGALSNIYSTDYDNVQPPIFRLDSDSYLGPIPDVYPDNLSLVETSGWWSNSDVLRFGYSTSSPAVFGDAVNRLEEPISIVQFADGTESSTVRHCDNPTTAAEYPNLIPPAPSRCFDGSERNSQLSPGPGQACDTKAERKERPVEVPMSLDYIYESCDNGKLVPVKDFTRIMEMSYLGIEERKDIVRKQYEIAREKCCLDWIESIRNRGKRILPKWWLQKYMKSDGLESNKCRKRREWLERKQAEALEAERLKEMEDPQTNADENRTFPQLLEPIGADRLLYQYSEDGSPLFDIQEYFASYLVENDGLSSFPRRHYGQSVPFEATGPIGDSPNFFGAFRNTELSPAGISSYGPHTGTTLDSRMRRFSDSHQGNCASGEPQQTENRNDVKVCRQVEIEKEDGSGDSLHEI